MKHRVGRAGAHRAPAARPRRRGPRHAAAPSRGVLPVVAALALAVGIGGGALALQDRVGPEGGLLALGVGPAGGAATVRSAPAVVPETSRATTRDEPERRTRSASSAQAAAALTHLARSPQAIVQGMAPTRLEQREPDRLYSLVTPDRAVWPLRYVPQDLVAIQGGPYQARAEVVEHLDALFAEAASHGHDQLSVNSGYRSYETQAGTHADWVARVGGAEAAQVSATAGYSEHQLGLAVDITGACGQFACLGSSEDGLWVARNAHRFGFIVRYPDGGEEVTGYDYEPWHLRYVGPRAAWTMHLQGERYWEHQAGKALEAAQE